MLALGLREQRRGTKKMQCNVGVVAHVYVFAWLFVFPHLL